jgi:hypothetical protein
VWVFERWAVLASFALLRALCAKPAATPMSKSSARVQGDAGVALAADNKDSFADIGNGRVGFDFGGREARRAARAKGRLAGAQRLLDLRALFASVRIAQ